MKDPNISIEAQIAAEIAGSFASGQPAVAAAGKSVYITDSGSFHVLNGLQSSVTIVYGTAETILYAGDIDVLTYEPFTDGSFFNTSDIFALNMKDVWHTEGHAHDVAFVNLNLLNGAKLSFDDGFSMSLTNSWNSIVSYDSLVDGNIDDGYDNHISIGDLLAALSISGDNQNVVVGDGEGAEIKITGVRTIFKSDEMDGAIIEIDDAAEETTVVVQEGDVTYNDEGEDIFEVDMTQAKDVVIAGGEDDDTFVFDFDGGHATADVVIMDFKQGEDNLEFDLSGMTITGEQAETFFAMYSNNAAALEIGDSTIYIPTVYEWII